MADRNLRIRMLMEAADRVSRPLKDIAGGSRAASAELRGTRDRLREIDRAQEQIQGFRTLKLGMRQTEQQMQSAQARVTALGREMAQATTPTRAMTREFEKAKREAGQLERQHRSEAIQLGELRTRLREAGIETRDLARHERELRERARDTNRELSAQERHLERVTSRQERLGRARERFDRTSNTARNIAGSGFAAAGTAVAAAAPVVASAKVAMGLEEGMAGVAKVTGMADAQIRQMQGSIVDLTTKIPMTAVELADIAAAGAAAGVGMDKSGTALASQREDLIAFSGDAARMGIAFDMAAEDAGSTMAKWRQAFKMTQPDVVALGDRVNALTNKFGGKAASVAGIVTRIGPLGEVAGIAAPQVAALASSLNSIGVEEEIAATGIKNTLLTLTKGTAAAKSQKAAFKSLGLDAGKVAKAMQVNSSGTIVDVLERVGRLSTDKQASVLSELFGTESVGAIAPLLTNLDGLKERLGLVADQSRYAGSMTNEFLSRINTTQGATDLAANGLQAINLELGQELLPNVKAAAQYTGGLATRMRAWAKEHPGFAKALMYTAAGAAGLFALFAGGAILLASLMAPFAALSFASTALGISFGGSMLKVAKGLMYPIRYVPMLGRAFLGLAGTVARAGLMLLANPMTWIVLGIVAAVALLAYGAYKLYQNWDGVAAWFGSMWTRVKGFFAGGIDAVVGFASTLWPRIKGYLVGWIVYLSPLPGMLTNIGRNLIQGLINGVTGMLGQLKSTIVNAATSAANWFKQKLGIHSPSRVFMGFGGFMMQGLHNGIDRGADGPVNRISRLSRDLTGALAIGAATPALAGGLAPAGAPGSSAASAAPPRTYIIKVEGGTGGPSEIEAAVRRAIEQVERQRSANSRSAFADDADWNV
ncbi:phage tail tape measure protein [Sphingomonas sp. 3-13AW]|uniref:phage tail tape measure protein n=1 Tax=Sphingomonas sp. 3-13AW TaxID=3050450 RepID=UPI003BB589C4